MEDKSQFWGEASLMMVFGPFAVALSLFGVSLAFMSGRFLFDVASNGGRLPPRAYSPEK